MWDSTTKFAESISLESGVQQACLQIRERCKKWITDKCYSPGDVEAVVVYLLFLFRLLFLCQPERERQDAVKCFRKHASHYVFAYLMSPYFNKDHIPERLRPGFWRGLFEVAYLAYGRQSIRLQFARTQVLITYQWFPDDAITSFDNSYVSAEYLLDAGCHFKLNRPADKDLVTILKPLLGATDMMVIVEDKLYTSDAWIMVDWLGNYYDSFIQVYCMILDPLFARSDFNQPMWDQIPCISILTRKRELFWHLAPTACPSYEELPLDPTPWQALDQAEDEDTDLVITTARSYICPLLGDYAEFPAYAQTCDLPHVFDYTALIACAKPNQCPSCNRKLVYPAIRRIPLSEEKEGRRAPRNPTNARYQPYSIADTEEVDQAPAIDSRVIDLTQ